MCTLYSPLKPAVQPATSLPRSVVRQLEAARVLAREGLELEAATAYRNAVPTLRGVCVVLKAAVTAWRQAYIRTAMAAERAERWGCDAQAARAEWFERYEEQYKAESELVVWSRASVAA